MVGIRERIGQHHGRWRDVILIERRSPSVLPVRQDRAQQPHAETQPDRAGGHGNGHCPSGSRISGQTAVHWSVPDPVPVGDPASFDATVADLSSRVERLAPRLAATS